MQPRYRLLLVALYCLGLTSIATAQNRQVNGTTDANGIYLDTGTYNGNPYYAIDGINRFIYLCSQANGCGPTGNWVIATELPASPAVLANSASLLYFRPTTADPQPSTGTYQPVNGASPSAAVTDTPLPVELTSFEAVTSGQHVQLRWTTASETNNAGFSVEMKQGESFVERGFVAGNGTTLEVQQYGFDAGELAPGRYTFRLRQVDFDGAFEYSPEVEVAVTLAEAFHFSAPQPNPMRSMARFSVTVQQAQPVAVRVYDMLGRAVETLFDGTMTQGETKTFVLNRGNLPAGLYLIQLQGVQVQSTRQITLL